LRTSSWSPLGPGWCLLTSRQPFHHLLRRPREDHLEIPCVGSDKRLIQSMVEHLVAHPAEAAASFLNTVEIGKALSQDRVTRAWPILSLAQTGKRYGRNGTRGPRRKDLPDLCALPPFPDSPTHPFTDSAFQCPFHDTR